MAVNTLFKVAFKIAYNYNDKDKQHCGIIFNYILYLLCLFKNVNNKQNKRGLKMREIKYFHCVIRTTGDQLGIVKLNNMADKD